MIWLALHGAMYVATVSPWAWSAAHASCAVAASSADAVHPRCAATCRRLKDAAHLLPAHINLVLSWIVEGPVRLGTLCSRVSMRLGIGSRARAKPDRMTGVAMTLAMAPRLKEPQ